MSGKRILLAGAGPELSGKLIPFLVHRMSKHPSDTMSWDEFVRRLETEPWFALSRELQGHLNGIELTELKGEAIPEQDTRHFLDLVDEFIELLVMLKPTLPATPTITRELEIKPLLRALIRWCDAAHSYGSLSPEQLHAPEAREIDVLLMRMRTERSLAMQPAAPSSAVAQSSIQPCPDPGFKKRMLEWADSQGIEIVDQIRRPSQDLPEMERNVVESTHTAAPTNGMDGSTSPRPGESGAPSALSEYCGGDERFPASEWITLVDAVERCQVSRTSLHRWKAELSKNDVAETQPRRCTVMRRTALQQLLRGHGRRCTL